MTTLDTICKELSTVKTNHEYYLERIEKELFKGELSAENISSVVDAFYQSLKFPQPKILEDEKQTYKEANIKGFLNILNKMMKIASSDIIKKILKSNVKFVILFACIEICQEYFKWEWMKEFAGIIRLKDIFEESFVTNGYISEDLLVLIFNEVKQYLGSETWKNSMKGFGAYIFVAKQLNKKAISSNLSLLLPFALTLADDYNEQFVMNGMELITLFLEKIPSATLRRLGWADVIYDAVKKKMYSTNPTILNITLRTLLLALKMIENDPKSVHFKRGLTKYNEVLQIIITNLQMSTSQAMRRVYSKHLSSYIEVMGISVVWNHKDLLQTFQTVFEYADIMTSKYIIHSLSTLISVAWPRMKNHGKLIVKMLLKLMYDVELKYKNNPSLISKEQLQSFIDEIIRCMTQVFILMPSLGKSTYMMMKSSAIPAFQKNYMQLAQYFPACELEDE